MIGVIVYFVVIGILAHVIGEALPRRIFSPRAFIFSQRPWEQEGAVYERLGIRRWKDRLPDTSKICRYMTKKALPRGVASHQVDALVRETCVSEAVHASLCLASLAALLLWRGWGGILACIVYILGNLPFIMIQRYNRPHLMGLSERLKKREERKRANEGSGTVV
jgi:glycosyl-4,4'-diaponeurosporenoate acyltransferase